MFLQIENSACIFLHRVFVSSTGQLPELKPQDVAPFQSFLQPIILFYETVFSLTLPTHSVLQFTRCGLVSWAKTRPIIFLTHQSPWGAPRSNVLYLPCLLSFSIPCCYLWLRCYGWEYFFVLA